MIHRHKQTKQPHRLDWKQPFLDWCSHWPHRRSSPLHLRGQLGIQTNNELMHSLANTKRVFVDTCNRGLNYHYNMQIIDINRTSASHSKEQATFACIKQKITNLLKWDGSLRIDWLQLVALFTRNKKITYIHLLILTNTFVQRRRSRACFYLRWGLLRLRTLDTNAT